MRFPTCIAPAVSGTVERALARLAGVQDVRANLTEKRVELKVDSRDRAGEIETALSSLGFQAAILDASVAEDGRDPRGRDLLLRLGVAGFAAMNVMLLSVSVWSGAEGATRDFLHWISAAIALPAIAFSAVPFFQSALTALSARRLNMDVPIALAILLASVMSLTEISQSGADAYFDAALSLTFFLLLGRYLDHRTRRAAHSAADDLAAMDVPRANVRRGDTWVEVLARDLRPGDLVMVRRGARIPADGMVVEGRSDIDISLLTGEAAPTAAGPGGTVHAGTLNLTGPLQIRVTGAGEDTALGSMRRLIADAEATRNRFTTLADHAARIYAPLVHGLAFLAFLYWQATTGDTRFAITTAIAVLIITCPCALGLAVPAVMTAANRALFRAGVLVKSATALERLAGIDRVVFDKTGTLTTGAPRLVTEHERKDLALAAALADASDHPYARAIVKAAEGVARPEIEGLAEIPGEGVRATWNGAEVSLGRGNGDGAETWLTVAGQSPVRFGFADTAVSGASDAVTALSHAGLPVTILTGDKPAPAAAFASTLGVTDVRADLRPEDKVGIIEAFGGRALMVGDGLNDAPALAGAHVSASPAAASDVARSAADLLLLSDGIRRLPGIIRLARAARMRILENFGIAALYNLISVPLAFSGMVTPLMAALAMSTSSILVTLNALRIRRVN